MAGAPDFSEETERRLVNANAVLADLIRKHVGTMGRYGEIGVKLRLANGQVSEVIQVEQISHK